MKKILYTSLVLLTAFVLCACGNSTPAAPPDAPAGSPEPEITPDPAWFSEDVIDEAVSYIFPQEDKINVDMAQGYKNFLYFFTLLANQFSSCGLTA